MTERWLHAAKCPVRIWEQVGRGCGYPKPACNCKAPAPKITVERNEALPFEMPEIRAEHLESLAPSLNCGQCNRRPGAFHAEWCVRIGVVK